MNANRSTFDVTQFQDVRCIINPTAEAAEGLSSDDVSGDSEVSPLALTEAPGTPLPHLHPHPLLPSTPPCTLGLTKMHHG